MPPPLVRLTKALDQPVYVVTGRDADGVPQGCLVGFATQASIHPLRFLACVSRENRTFSAAESAPAMAVHVLDRSRGSAARLFGGETGDDVDKFARCAWREGPGGVPVLQDCAAWFAGPVVARFDMGDHLGVLIAPEHGEDGPVRPQMTVHDLAGMEPGHHP